MLDGTNCFSWMQLLECPPAICPPPVQKILCKGVYEFLWSDMAATMFPATQVVEIRKNILLYKLKHNIPDNSIEDTRSMFQLKMENDKQNNDISSLEKKCKEQNVRIGEKMQHLKKIKDTHSLLKVKRNILKIKCNEMKTQLNDCSDMRLACRQLMPSSLKDVDQGKIKEGLNTVSSLWHGINKKQVWQTVSNLLGSIEIPILCKFLFQNLQDDTDKLSKRGTISYSSECNAIGENIDIGIARICGEHMNMILKKLLSNPKADRYQQSTIEFIEKIEISSINCDDVSEWMVLILEVQKLEVEQKYLEVEINQMKEYINDNINLVSNYTEVVSNIRNLDAEIEEYIQDVQRSLVRLKSAASLIIDIKDKLSYELRQIAAMRMEEYCCKWLNDDLNTELNIFNDVLDLCALRKIMLKGDIGSYRYTKSCFSEAFTSMTNLRSFEVFSYCPIIQIPLYALIECYKQLLLSVTYKKLGCPTISNEMESVKSKTLTGQKRNYNTIELLNVACTKCENAREEIDQFNNVLNEWENQILQDIVKLQEKYVDNKSFSDWSQQYSLFVYMIQSSK